MRGAPRIAFALLLAAPAAAAPVAAAPAAAALAAAAPVAAPASPTPAQDTTPVRRFEQGTEFLASGRYSDAVDAFLEVEATGSVSLVLYYDLGVAYYRLDRLGDAVRYFERARRLAPDDRLVLHNLEIVRSRLRDRFARLPTPFLARWWQRLVLTISTAGLFSIGAAAWLLLSVLGAVAVRRGGFLPWMRRAALVAGVASVSFLGGAFHASARDPFGNRSVVIESAMPLQRAAAGTDTVMELHEGTVVDVLETQGGWTRVRLENGVTGWLETQGLAAI